MEGVGAQLSRGRSTPCPCGAPGNSTAFPPGKSRRCGQRARPIRPVGRLSPLRGKARLASAKSSYPARSFGFGLGWSHRLSCEREELWMPPSVRRASAVPSRQNHEAVEALQPRRGSRPAAPRRRDFSSGLENARPSGGELKSLQIRRSEGRGGKPVSDLPFSSSNSGKSSSRKDLGSPKAANLFLKVASKAGAAQRLSLEPSTVQFIHNGTLRGSVRSQRSSDSRAEMSPGTSAGIHVPLGKSVPNQTPYSPVKQTWLSGSNAFRNTPDKASSGVEGRFSSKPNYMEQSEKLEPFTSDSGQDTSISTRRSLPNQPSTRTVPNFPSRSRIYSSESSSRPGSGSGGIKMPVLPSEYAIQRQPTSARGSRRELGQASPSLESLDRLLQQLQESTSVSSSKRDLQKPLDPEESVRLKERFKKMKEKSMREIHRRLFHHSRPEGEGEEFSCAVEPNSLIVGEYVVHKRVGIGQYIGMKTEVPKGKVSPSTYVYLKYADGVAKLKAKQARRLLYRYHLPGDNSSAPMLSKLKDPGTWEKRKSKGKIAIQKMVVNMMELYIHRLKQSRPLYPKRSLAFSQFISKFPHKPTPDQLQAFADVERDLTEVDLPMDRLICGDVGFGKTEVALRAMFFAVAGGKQVMVLAPSTVLAKQHYDTVRNRFAGVRGVKVALLCRFQKDAAKKELIVRIQDGSLNIIVGTHSLLGNQIRYNNLGLLIIDEEQRFGVKQKEKITCVKTSVDVLTLTATPIPRTLCLAMSGFRDASLLTTPPPERRPIRTHLAEYDERRAKAAIEFELDRGGQVFYVVPRVKGMEELHARLQSQFPDVKVAVAHGKQSASALEEAMEKFCEGEIKILLCTNIIESGLDIRMVNTIIVEDVQHFGLAQLYQLRGRVGRAHREAHAYLFYADKSLLTKEALERLVALQDCCDLGQGFHLAERDMAIRGIGTLFGEQQSGDAAKIGTDLYFEMLLEGLSKVDAQRLPTVEYDNVQLELGVDAYLPSDYVESPGEREEVMRSAKRAAQESLRALMLYTNRLREKYGREPASMEMLLKTIYARRMAADLGIHRIRTQGTSIMMETNMSMEAFEMIASCIPSESVRSSMSFEAGCIEMQGLIGLPTERQMERVFCCLADMFNGLPSFVKYM